MTTTKVPGQLAVEQVAELRNIINLDFEDIENAIVAAIEADRAQRPALEQWLVFEVGYPNDGDTFNCDEATAEEIARSYGADENNCGACYGYRKIGA